MYGWLNCGDSLARIRLYIIAAEAKMRALLVKLQELADVLRSSTVEDTHVAILLVWESALTQWYKQVLAQGYPLSCFDQAHAALGELFWCFSCMFAASVSERPAGKHSIVQGHRREGRVARVRRLLGS
jgi:hypothetical protein